ncbi:histidinol-phosphate transaminase [Halioglobus japonicus]|uniref:Histidinol-phosphate aminotransferase n=1 Tax=Halioglobus japonicus TaxID=930805 RepID=A0AAP8SNP9_9GAMM|nr:histidinol-phosphate transaminase [Halioglobus japonicus]AQA18831.1 histidinol-phosphate transaminase [Halioglobus japonicus]PLW86865.1 histidinol-phosphate transaminase [Halioglobus japonicus]GHD23642.1 histidinol-phosphate aminotransferase 1 [Halioglobus japonicus]
MSRFWSDLASQLTPYVPGEQPKAERLVKLNTNENPYGPSPAVLEAIAGTSASELKRYPDPDSSALKAAFAEREGLTPEQVFLGNGSDEVLAHTFQALLKHDKPLLFPDISYSFYPVWSELYQVNYQPVPLRDDFTIDVDAYSAPNSGILIPNPNAPTGVLLPREDIVRLLGAHPESVVVIDEAYIDFGGESATALIAEHNNLLVIQTVSKSRSLAGMRVGAAFGQAPLIEGLVRVKDSFNSYPMDVVAQRATLASLADEAWFRQCCDKVVATRERTDKVLRDLGFAVLPSAANFIFARHPGHDAAQIFAALRERGIVVRYFSKPRIDQFLRISIGTDEEMDELFAALAEILAM